MISCCFFKQCKRVPYYKVAYMGTTYHSWIILDHIPRKTMAFSTWWIVAVPRLVSGFPAFLLKGPGAVSAHLVPKTATPKNISHLMDPDGIIKSGWWLSHPLKNMNSSVGMMKFPIYGKLRNVPNHQPVMEWYVWYGNIDHPLRNLCSMYDMEFVYNDIWVNMGQWCILPYTQREDLCTEKKNN